MLGDSAGVPRRTNGSAATQALDATVLTTEATPT